MTNGTAPLAAKVRSRAHAIGGGTRPLPFKRWEYPITRQWRVPVSSTMSFGSRSSSVMKLINICRYNQLEEDDAPRCSVGRLAVVKRQRSCSKDRHSVSAQTAWSHYQAYCASAMPTRRHVDFHQLLVIHGASRYSSRTHHRLRRSCQALSTNTSVDAEMRYAFASQWQNWNQCASYETVFDTFGQFNAKRKKQNKKEQCRLPHFQKWTENSESRNSCRYQAALPAGRSSFSEIG